MPWRAEPAQSRDARAGRDLRKCGESPCNPQGMGQDPNRAMRVGNHGLISRSSILMLSESRTAQGAADGRTVPTEMVGDLAERVNAWGQGSRHAIRVSMVAEPLVRGPSSPGSVGARVRATPGPRGCAVAGKRAPSGDAERGNPGTADSMIYAMIARFACNDQGKVGGGRSVGRIPAGCVVVEPVGEPLGEAIAAEGTLGGEDLPNHSIGRARPANGLPFSSRDLKRIPPIPPQAEQGEGERFGAGSGRATMAAWVRAAWGGFLLSVRIPELSRTRLWSGAGADRASGEAGGGAAAGQQIVPAGSVPSPCSRRRRERPRCGAPAAATDGGPGDRSRTRSRRR
jgi:hypothetical protein